MSSKADHQYFDEYTGIKNHSNRLKGWFAPIHETKLRLNYTYYNSPEITQRIIDWYNKIDPGGELYDYSIIDDGSQDKPITDMDIPTWWTVWRIDKDHGWNNEGARNCLIKESRNEWNLMMDSDWVISARCLQSISNNIVFLDSEFMYFPGNFGPKVGRNSYLVTRTEYLKRGGYDQAFIGYHGNDYSLLRYNKPYNYSDFFWFHRLEQDVVDPDEKKRMEEVKRFHNLMIELEEKGYGYRCPHDKQDFTWTDHEKHKEMWVSLDYERLQ